MLAGVTLVASPPPAPSRLRGSAVPPANITSSNLKRQCILRKRQLLRCPGAA